MNGLEGTEETTEGGKAELGDNTEEATNEREKGVEETVNEADDSIDKVAEDLADSLEDVTKDGEVTTEDLEQGTEGVNDECKDLAEEHSEVGNGHLDGLARRVDGSEDGSEGLACEVLDVIDGRSDDVNNLLKERVNNVRSAVSGDDRVYGRLQNDDFKRKQELLTELINDGSKVSEEIVQDRRDRLDVITLSNIDIGIGRDVVVLYVY